MRPKNTNQHPYPETPAEWHMKPMSPNMCRDRLSYWTCTLRKDHPGCHIAAQTSEFAESLPTPAQWDQSGRYVPFEFAMRSREPVPAADEDLL